MDATAISELLTPVLERRGLELDSLQIQRAGNRSLVRVTVDGDGASGKGPTLDEIADATRDISDALDASPLTGDKPYVLEVSSRGVGKPLTTPAHWRRNTGRLVAATLAEGQVTGRIAHSDDDGVTLTVDGAEQRLSYADIRKAAVQVELNRAPDPTLDDVGDETDDEDEEN